ncbi:MAG: 2-oxoacid:ferredoxin oxidoreductase subunit beta [Candidatus Riflebacteria bacterium]|nr:2-oxoacid:ferredoxin oxidoreductase subunit beta [Candidatus Riflebacteria bacterium]
MMEDIVHQYLRPKKKFPHVWCPGCGDGVVMNSLIRAIHSLKISRDNIVMVSGIGCSSRAPVYFDFCSLHSTHGRALPFATGVKLGNPKLTVIVISGDGDATAIGGNHFIHACRRNIDLKMVLINNNIYGMTGGQYSPTMPTGAYAATAPYGNIDRPFDICKLAVAAGANYVARSTAFHTFQIEKYFKEAIMKPGFAVIEAMTACPSLYSFYNKTGKGTDMMKALKDRAISIESAANMSPEDLKEKIVTGIFANGDAKPYTVAYQELMERAERSRVDEESI